MLQNGGLWVSEESTPHCPSTNCLPAATTKEYSLLLPNGVKPPFCPTVYKLHWIVLWRWIGSYLLLSHTWIRSGIRHYKDPRETHVINVKKWRSEEGLILYVGLWLYNYPLLQPTNTTTKPQTYFPKPSHKHYFKNGHFRSVCRGLYTVHSDHAFIFYSIWWYEFWAWSQSSWRDR